MVLTRADVRVLMVCSINRTDHVMKRSCGINEVRGSCSYGM